MQYTETEHSRQTTVDKKEKTKLRKHFLKKSDIKQQSEHSRHTTLDRTQMT